MPEHDWLEKLAIPELCARYRRTIDNHDCQGWAACFAEDGAVELGGPTKRPMPHQSPELKTHTRSRLAASLRHTAPGQPHPAHEPGVSRGCSLRECGRKVCVPQNGATPPGLATLGLRVRRLNNRNASEIQRNYRGQHMLSCGA
jgi:hypothetical protein